MQGLDENIRPISVHGIEKRKTKPQKWLTYSYDQCADGAFKLAGKFLKYVEHNWDDLQFNQRLSAVTALLPISLKRIPDKHEVIALTLNASADDMARLLHLAECNLQARASVTASHAVVKQLPQVVDTVIVTATKPDEK